MLGRNRCTDVVFPFQSPPREGSQGELAPANSQTRMSTNMWGGWWSPESACWPCWQHQQPGGSTHHCHPHPPNHPQTFCLSLLQTEGTKHQRLYSFDPLYPITWSVVGGGGGCFVSSDLENWKRVLMKTWHLSCTFSGRRRTLLCLHSLTATRF